MGYPIYQVDAFTDRAFAGNPAAVCILYPKETAADAWMQAVAAEMNLAETAFLAAGADGYDLRWFTPTVEVDLCGHATLASAHILWETGRLAETAEARFHTRSGLLTALRQGSRVELDFPAERALPIDSPAGLEEALGAELVYVGRNRFDILAEVRDARVLRALQPDLERLAKIPARGVIATCRSDDARFDFLSRFFAPASGIDEDPVTGSAHCCLGPFWQDRLNRAELTGYQASARGGVVGVRVEGDRVKLVGEAVTIFKGELIAIG